MSDSSGQRPSEVLEAAGIGHRITHEGDLPPARQMLYTALLWANGAVAQQHGDGALLAALLAEAASAVGPEDEVEEVGDRAECPDPTGAIEKGSVDTFIGPERRGCALVDEDLVVPCENDSDGPIVMGAAHVWVNRKRLARRTDELDCGALIGEGEPTVLIGAPAEGAAEKEPDREAMLEATLLAVLLSSGGLGDPDSAWGAQLGAIMAGHDPQEVAAKLGELVDKLGTLGPAVADKIAEGDWDGIVDLISGSS